MNFTLNLNREQFMTIMALLHHVRLGNGDKFTSAISDLVIDLEANGWSKTFDSLKNDFGVPEVSVSKKQNEIILSEGEVEW